jgi:hypothetical protein
LAAEFHFSHQCCCAVAIAMTDIHERQALLDYATPAPGMNLGLGSAQSGELDGKIIAMLLQAVLALSKQLRASGRAGPDTRERRRRK